MSDLVKRLREFDWHDPPRKGADELLNEAANEIERLRGFLIEISEPGTLRYECVFLARKALETQAVTVHGPQCDCSRCKAQIAVHTL